MQILADVTGFSVRAVPEGGEAALGDAMVAALGLGMTEVDGLASWLAHLPQRVFEPQEEVRRVYTLGFARYLGLYGHLRPWFAEE